MTVAQAAPPPSGLRIKSAMTGRPFYAPRYWGESSMTVARPAPPLWIADQVRNDGPAIIYQEALLASGEPNTPNGFKDL